MSPLADLYSTSTLEHHHFDQCIMILSTEVTWLFGKAHEILARIAYVYNLCKVCVKRPLKKYKTKVL